MPTQAEQDKPFKFCLGCCGVPVICLALLSIINGPAESPKPPQPEKHIVAAKFKSSRKPVTQQSGHEWNSSQRTKKFRPYCEEYIRTEWQQYVLYQEGRYSWSIPRIKTKEKQHTIDLNLIFTNHLRQPEVYDGTLVVEEIDGNLQIISKGPWCSEMNGKIFCIAAH